MLVVKARDDQEARFAAGAGGNFQEGWIVPKGLGRKEVDAVFLKVGSVFGGIEGEVHLRRIYTVLALGSGFWGLLRKAPERPRQGPRQAASAPCGLSQKLLNPDPVPLLANQPRHRWGGIGHPEGCTEGTGESVSVAGGEGFELLLKLEGDGGLQQGIRAGGLALVAIGGGCRRGS